MPDDATGTYHLPPIYFVTAGDTVLPTQHNPPFEDVAAALSSRLHADGRRSWEGSQNAGGNKITNLAEGVASSDAATVGQAVLASNPIGAMLDYAGDTAPTRYMLCYGQAISRTDYAALFAIIGTKFGTGDGSTTFNLPDCRGRVSAGKDDMGGAAAGLLTTSGSGINGTLIGAAGGAQTHILTLAQLAAHTHTASSGSAGAHSHSGTTGDSGSHTHTASSGEAGGHTHSGTTSTTGDHAHAYAAANAISLTIQAGVSGYAAVQPANWNTGGAGAHSHTFTTGWAGAHSHSVTVNNVSGHTHDFTTGSAGDHSHAITVNSNGSGQAHNNTQPTIIFNKIIKVI